MSIYIQPKSDVLVITDRLVQMPGEQGLTTISFHARRDGMTVVSTKGRKSFVVCKEMVEDDDGKLFWNGYYTARFIDQDPCKLHLFIMEKTERGAYQVALLKLWGVQEQPVIKGKRIIFGDHAVQMRAGKDWDAAFVTSYLKDMADELSATGTAEQHRRELSRMNNDGTWAVVNLAA